jgi:hypothetical protein
LKGGFFSRLLANFTVEISGLDYGFPINGILGMDFLTRTGAILNLQAPSLEFAQDIGSAAL